MNVTKVHRSHDRQSRFNIMTTVLKCYFGVVETLREYLSHILEPSDGPSFTPTDEDSELYRELVNNAYVGLAGNCQCVFQVGLPIADMKEVTNSHSQSPSFSDIELRSSDSQY